MTDGISGIRLQPGEHRFPPFLLVCRVAVTTDFEACMYVGLMFNNSFFFIDDIRLDPIAGYRPRYVSGVSNLLIPWDDT